MLYKDPDCGDGSDEVGCERPDCSKHPLFWDPEQKFINCPSTTACIHPDWICDGQVCLFNTSFSFQIFLNLFHMYSIFLFDRLIFRMTVGIIPMKPIVKLKPSKPHVLQTHSNA
jgi:hypothetical protein